MATARLHVSSPAMGPDVAMPAPGPSGAVDPAVSEGVYPLSPVQEAMLYHALASDAPDLYKVQQRIEIDGPVDAESFRKAWSFVIRRHPALRTVFRWEHQSAPTQIVLRDLELPVEAVDLTADPDADATMEGWFEADRLRRMDLDRPPLMRVVMFRLEPARHVLLWSQHHLLEDGWSAANVLAEVFAAYEAFAAGKTPQLPPVRPFSAYIEWLQQRVTQESESFWRSHLAAFSEPTRMAPPREASGVDAYARRFHSLTPDATTELRERARQLGLSPNSVLVGALAIAIARYTGRRDIAIGVVAAGRPPELEGVEAMVGMFINTLVLRVEVDDEAPVTDWLHEVQTRQAAVLEHDHCALTDVQAWSELPPGTTPTDVLFAYWNFGGTGSAPSGTPTYRTVEGHGRTSFPFSITVESSDPITIGLDFDGGDVDTAHAVQFLRHFATLLDSIVSEPDVAVGALEMFSPPELAARAAYNETKRPVPFSSVSL